MLHSVAHATLSLRCIKVSREKSCNEQLLRALQHLIVVFIPRAEAHNSRLRLARSERGRRLFFVYLCKAWALRSLGPSALV